MNNPLLLLADQAEQAPGIVDKILDSGVLLILIPLSAIIGGVAIAIVKTIIRHRERMAGLPPPPPLNDRSYWEKDSII
jgi:hypothetical protein